MLYLEWNYVASNWKKNIPKQQQQQQQQQQNKK